MTKPSTPTKTELVESLAAAGKGTEAKLRRLSLAALTELAAPTSKKPKAEKPSADAALKRVAKLLGLKLGETKEMSSYTRAAATGADGQAFTLYRNATNVGVVPKGLPVETARELLAKFQEQAGGKIRESKAELLVPDEAAR